MTPANVQAYLPVSQMTSVADDDLNGCCKVLPSWNGRGANVRMMFARGYVEAMVTNGGRGHPGLWKISIELDYLTPSLVFGEMSSISC